MTDKESDIAKAREIADKIRELWPDKAALIEKAIEDFIAGRRDGLKVTGTIVTKLEKFDGDFRPGMTPVETIETKESI